MPAAPRPFRLQVPETAIDDLRERLARTRFPDQAPGEAWSYGTDLGWLRELVAHWRERFDWRAQEARLNAFPQFKVALAGIDLHFIRAQGQGPAPMPLLLSHGWPGSVFEFLELIPRLTDPARFGGDAADAFTVIAPSLPGYGLSFAPGQPRFSCEQIADCFAELMGPVLGFDRFAAQGGDWGSFITSRIGFAHPEKVIGIHLNMMPLRRDRAMVEDPTPDERRYLDELALWLREETGYQWIQGTRPQTLAFGLTDSPAGLAAWIGEKFRAWSDCDGDARERDRAATRCLRTSRCTGSPARSVRRSGPTTRACTDRGRSRTTVPWTCPPATASSRTRSCARRARWPSAPTPTSGAGA